MNGKEILKNVLKVLLYIAVAFVLGYVIYTFGQVFG